MLLAGTLHSDRFLSTPSARRATMEQIRRRINNGISIHALREEGDLRSLNESLHRTEISIHALREEGDEWAGMHRQGIQDFYPRPPRGGRQTSRFRKPA